MSKPTPSDYMESFRKNNPFIHHMQRPYPYFTGRESEIMQVAEYLCKIRMQNVILVGKPGIGKTQIVRKVAQKSHKFSFFEFDLCGLVSGCLLVGMLEKRIGSLLEYVSTYNTEKGMTQKIVLFIDEIHALWGLNGSKHNGTMSANDILKPYLADGRIIIVGATTEPEFKEKILTDKAFMRRFSVVYVDEPDKETTMKAMRSFAETIGLSVDEAMMNKVYEASKSIAGFTSNPDASLELLDRLYAKSIVRKRAISESLLDEVIKDAVKPLEMLKEPAWKVKMSPL